MLVCKQLLTKANFIQTIAVRNPSISIAPYVNSTKWIVVGGSYSGSLAAWMKLKYPEIVFGAHASSAPVLAKLDFWEYADAVRLGLPLSGGSQQCVDGWIKTVAAFDAFTSNHNSSIVLDYFKAP